MTRSTFLCLCSVLLFAGSAARAATIAGTAFRDLDASATLNTGDTAMSGATLYLFTSSGTYLAQAKTDAQGAYRFAGLAAGSYRVQYDALSWWSVRLAWVPTTTGTLFPQRDVALGSSDVVADFGWRPIVRSTVLGSPITRFIGPSGLIVESYDDVVDARTLHDALAQGLVGEEAPQVTIRFDFGSGSSTSTSLSQVDGLYIAYSAAAYVTYESWLDGGDTTLAHEYGHAWSLYFAYLVQQDPGLADYLAARGLTGDARLGTSYAWSPREILAEDYRQLLGSPTARLAPQTNRDLPAAAQVAGLADYLTNAFTTPPPSSAIPLPPPLAVTGLAVTPAPVTTTGTVAFTLSVGATITVEILTGRGTLVRTLASGFNARAGANAFAWNRVDAKNRKVRAGSYAARIRAWTTDGLSVVQLVGFTVK